MKLPLDRGLAKAKGTKDLPLVQVVWRDHASSDSWASIAQHRERMTPVEVVSSGRLIGNHRSHIQVAQNVSEEGQAFNVLCILKSCIVRVRRLKEVGR